ncbi:MAG: YceI family protein [Saprospiraceae bacterium]|nr:YceI family protein [Saprospiraceae bacterium]
MATTKWALDLAHSEIQFKVKHMMITTVTGGFDKFDATVKTEGEDFSTANISFEAETASVNTGAADRDKHLRSSDFFDAEKFPIMKFEATEFKPTGDNGDYELKGNLTIKDTTKPVKLDVEFGGIGKDPWGNTKAGFTLSGKISRKDWGLTWNAALETGGVLVSDEVKLLGEIQLMKAS